MKNLKYLIVCLVLISFSCKENEQPQFATVDMMAFITVLDEQGNNLLDPNQEGAYYPKDIKIFYERDGKMVEFYEGYLTMPRNFRIDPPEFGSDYLLALALDSEKTVIQWNEAEADTIIAEIQDNASSVIVQKVYYQGQLMHELPTTKRRGFTIIKPRQ
ncbi:hypothetical protein [Algoriphagus marinus]|uniref:hypothetical protein n=1 Tax=Algoriphagus marinus TaxID=1925762 RepID=UPI00094B8FF6|nr:hypothetical protein [Algoriphagus marinus]